jgi:hypothetical protein
MRLLTALAIVATCVTARAQIPRLGSATAVDVRVKSIEWHPAGRALSYIREGDRTDSLGVYVLGAKEGTVLLTFDKDDTIETRWFPEQQALVAMVFHNTASSSTVTATLIDAKSRVAHSLFTEAYDRSKTFKVDFFNSPSQLHAIFRINEDNAVKHLVLPAGAHRVIASPDLDQANAEGRHDPIWSVDGTAIFSGGSEDSNANKYSESYWRTATETSKQGEGKVPILGDLPVIGRMFWARTPVPETGSNVLELMPSNAVLRPVRFRGPFESVGPPKTAMETKSHPVELRFGPSKGSANSLWLGQESDSVLVAAHADEGWLSPWTRSIAYLTDGALFFRSIGTTAE